MNNRYEWTRWFAWYPVSIGGRLRWMRYVECREIGVVTPEGDQRAGELVNRWVYRLPEIVDLSQ